MPWFTNNGRSQRFGGFNQDYWSLQPYGKYYHYPQPFYSEEVCLAIGEILSNLIERIEKVYYEAKRNPDVVLRYVTYGKRIVGLLWTIRSLLEVLRWRAGVFWRKIREDWRRRGITEMLQRIREDFETWEGEYWEIVRRE